MFAPHLACNEKISDKILSSRASMKMNTGEYFIATARSVADISSNDEGSVPWLSSLLTASSTLRVVMNVSLLVVSADLRADFRYVAHPVVGSCSRCRQHLYFHRSQSFEGYC